MSAARRKRKCSDEQGVVDAGGVDNKADCGSYDFKSLVVGCSENSDTMEFYSSCDTEAVSCMFNVLLQCSNFLESQQSVDPEIKRKCETMYMSHD
jgi:hypothetical protein